MSEREMVAYYKEGRRLRIKSVEMSLLDSVQDSDRRYCVFCLVVDNYHRKLPFS